MNGHVYSSGKILYELSGKMGEPIKMRANKDAQWSVLFDPAKYKRCKIIFPKRDEADPNESLK